MKKQGCHVMSRHVAVQELVSERLFVAVILHV